MSLRVGIGYDSHSFDPDRPLILGGVEIPHDRGLAGHSDADVIVHALIDALLGACGQGDIGGRFPPSDARWSGADSVALLETVLAELPGEPANADLTLICEEPRLSEHRAAIESRLGEVLGAPVSVKATSNEGMGWIGRGEGVAAIAVALVDAR
jgi:2-C-methyl-D-erythritol 4-phosphate cytidylyltransferase/2-C-methyl-D-erythritol 2,4-cyclodiphosphate synthase